MKIFGVLITVVFLMIYLNGVKSKANEKLKTLLNTILIYYDMSLNLILLFTTV